MMEFVVQVMKKYATSPRPREIQTIHNKDYRYHLQGYKNRGRPCGAKVIFNNAHPSLRNIIDRCFNVLKLFSLYGRVWSLTFCTQLLLVFAAVTLHNYIWRKAQRDMLFEKYNKPVMINIANDDEDNEDETLAGVVTTRQ